MPNCLYIIFQVYKKIYDIIHYCLLGGYRYLSIQVYMVSRFGEKVNGFTVKY